MLTSVTNRRWRKLSREIAELKSKYRGKRWRDKLPDLSVEQRAAPCSNIIARIVYSSGAPSGARQYPVGHSHKQGLELITPGMIETGQLRHMGGAKPN